jgi:hypothetical protein
MFMLRTAAMPSHPTPHSRFLPGSHAAICDAPSVTADAGDCKRVGDVGPRVFHFLAKRAPTGTRASRELNARVFAPSRGRTDP